MQTEYENQEFGDEICKKKGRKQIKHKEEEEKPYRPTKNKPKNKLFFANNKGENNTFQNIIVVLNCCQKDLQKNTLTDDNDDTMLISETMNDEKYKEEEFITKIKKLQYDLYKNNCNETHKHCFWDTCFFDWKPFEIPKNIQGDKIIGYGVFCSPECALAFLNEEKINESDKQERRTLLNNIYRNNPNDKNFIPAKSPYYLLDKFLGNLTIEEYRNNFNVLNSFSFVNKPISRLLPELFENNSSNFIGKGNKKYRLKQATDK